MHALEQFLVHLATTLPLEFFVTLGSFFEEVIAPIPSPSILVIAGSFAVAQGYAPGELTHLVILAAIGKTLGGITMYLIAHHARGPFIRIFGRFIDIKEDELKRFGARFNGTFRDYALYTLLRAIPIIPSIVLSFGSGVIQLPKRLFVVGTFLGTVIRDTLYISVGYSGTVYVKTVLAHSNTIESLGSLVAYGIGAFLLLYVLYRAQRRRNARVSSPS